MMIVEPTWKRIGLTEPLAEGSGQEIVIIVMDDIFPHVSLRHLKERVKKVEVHKDHTVTCTNVFDEPLVKNISRYAEHGVSVLSLLAHQSLESKGNLYSGLAQSANFVFLPTIKPDRIEVGLEWILDQEWNTKILLDVAISMEIGWMSPTNQSPYIKAIQPALDAGLLVIAAGGNSKARNNMPPKEFFVIGGFNDKGLSNKSGYEEHPSVSYGWNGDGHWRPDLLAPYTYLPLPGLKGEGFDYFGGTCGSATLVAGLSAYFLSTMPDLSPNDIRNVLIDTADVIEGFPAPIINAEKALRALQDGYRNSNPPSLEPLVKVTDANQSIRSEDPLERALALTILIKDNKLSRDEIWKYADDESPMVKKVALQGLGDPIDHIEREKYWNRVHQDSSDFGVKECWAYLLLSAPVKEDLDHWMSLVDYKSIDIWICINLFLRKHYPDAPEIEHSPDSDPEVMDAIIAPVLDWYRSFKENL